MKNFTATVILLIFVTTAAFSQISVTSNSLQSWLGFQQIIESDTSGTVSVDVGAAGANQTWDFSALQGQSYTAVYEFFTSGSTPYVDNFPGANYAFKIEFQGDMFSGMMYQNVNLQTDKMQSLGNVLISSGTVIEIEQDNEVTPLPITFGKTWETVSVDTFEIPGISQTITTLTEKNTVDAWGTIKLPSGTYNCLRLRIDGTSEQVTKVGGIEIPIGSTTFIDYTWIGENSLLLATISSMENETDANFATASGATWLSSVSASTNVADAPTNAPNSFELLGNYPNPFNPSTTIFFQLDKTADVSLAIYDVHGRLVQQLVSGQYAAGQHQVEWNGANDQGEMVAGGTYFLKLSSSSNSLVRKMTLLK